MVRLGVVWDWVRSPGSVGAPKGGGPEPRKSGGPKGGRPKGGRPKGGGPKFRALFPSPAPIFSLFFLIGGSSHGFVAAVEAMAHTNCAFGLFWDRRPLGMDSEHLQQFPIRRLPNVLLRCWHRLWLRPVEDVLRFLEVW